MKKRIIGLTKITLLLMMVMVNSCSKTANPVPYYSVDFTLDLTLPEYSSLQTPGNWLYISTGSNTKGVIICNSPTNTNSPNPFIILDRTCTYNTTGYVTVNTKGTGVNVYATDSVCGSVFNIYNGAVQHSPATIPLKQYNSTLTGWSLHVYN